MLPFGHTDYYGREFGADLMRRVYTFAQLVDPGTLADIKLETNELESHWSLEGRRLVNLDPGYVSLAKLVLATTKNNAHRVYIGKGIFAEVTLRFRAGHFTGLEWTYPDYASPDYCALFDGIRSRYLRQLRG